MSDQQSSRFALPLLHAGQAQKEMTHNEALACLDFIIHPVARSKGLDVPPASPVEGAAWIVGSTPAEAWSGRSGALAGWTAGGWRFVRPVEGMRVWVEDDQDFVCFHEGGWTPARTYGRLYIDGRQIVGPQAPAIADPDGGTTADVQARETLVALLATLRAHGLIASGGL